MLLQTKRNDTKQNQQMSYEREYWYIWDCNKDFVIPCREDDASFGQSVAVFRTHQMKHAKTAVRMAKP